MTLNSKTAGSSGKGASMGNENDVTVTDDDLVESLITVPSLHIPLGLLVFEDARADEFDREYSRMIATLQIGNLLTHVIAIEVTWNRLMMQEATTTSNDGELDLMYELSGGGPFETVDIECPDSATRTYVIHILPFQS